LPAGFFSNGETVNITYDASNTTIHFIKSANHSGRKVGSAVGTYSFVAGGLNNIASNSYAYAEGGGVTASGGTSHAEGEVTTASGDTSHAEGYQTAANGDYSHAEGFTTHANGAYSHVEGYGTTANGIDGSHAEGSGTTASGDFSHAEGGDTTASDGGAHAEGAKTTASGARAHAEGQNTTASGNTSHAEGNYTIANQPYSHAGGTCNLSMSSGDIFVLGNGSGDIARSNCFRITNTGNVYGLAAFHSSGADYAEYFEWLDENVNKEDRAGYFVTLDGGEIKYANDGDYILGVTSAVPGIIGDSASESWKERWETDIFGRIQYHDVTVPAQKDNKGNVIMKERVESQPIINPNYDNSKPYTSREKRPEFVPVGMLGKLVCIDDGTCEVNGYCIPKDGIATKSEKGYRIIERLDDTHIKIIMR
jgi:hypothetical protein